MGDRSIRRSRGRQSLPWRLRRVQELFDVGHHLELLRDGAQAYPAMLNAIAGAQQQILLEMYWFSSDRIGQRFALALREAAERGVEVAVIYDSVGSMDTDPEMFAGLRAAGVFVLEFGPILPWKRRFKMGQLSRRDHRKLLVVDGRIGFTGGLNISDEWVPVRDGGEGWRDDAVRFEGSAVAGLARCFLVTWSAGGGRPLAELVQRSPNPEGEVAIRVIGEGFPRKRREIVRAYLSNIYLAESHIWLTNPYFVPDRGVVKALVRAARRGVDVRVLLPAASDMPFVQFASQALWGRLMRSGVRIFQWYGSVLHAKSAVIDGTWATTGTFNLDYRSIFWNQEVNVAVRDRKFAAVMEASFQKDLAQSHEVDREMFNLRPSSERWMEAICYLFRRFL